MSKILSAFCCVAALLAVDPAAAQMSQSEQILTILVGGGSYEKFFDNVSDPNHPKILSFTGTAINGEPQIPTTLKVWFDWIDPSDPPDPMHPEGRQPRVSPAQSYPMGFGANISQTFTIPFCPPRVSIHFENDGTAEGVSVSGTFTHVCVPEPGTTALGGLGGLALMALARRRRGGAHALG